MTAVTRSFVLVVTVSVIATGCGGGSGNAARTTTVKSKQSVVSPAALKGDVRSAIRANVQLSTYVLWHNQIPGWATNSTRGPALTSLRSAAAARRKQGIQIKNLSGGYTVLSVALDPSYVSASAVIRSHQRVAPYENGKRLGKAISASDHVRIQLHRLGSTQHFVVWRVAPIK